ncbi:MAG: hypothetical protein H0T97_08850 [Actinobacteria bacterium]|nr:hypothetical protein [Actinomycetota bacterium]
MILLTFLIGLGLVTVAATFCSVRGVRMWRQLKRTGKAMGAELDALEVRTARTETLLAQAERRSADLETALQRLRASRAQMQVLRGAIESAKARTRWLRVFLPI